MPDERTPDAREMGYYLSLAQVGVEMVAPLIVGVVIDSYLDTTPWFLIAGTVVGFVGGIWHIVLLANKPDAARRGNGKPGNNPP
jgi:F0F1-type ATP synthase assembly protein I